jgi:coenzyme Q-binding protein COQ10
MLAERIERELPFRREQLFDVAADIERYPDFLPWWISARIQRREGETLYVDQVLGIGPFRVGFTSQAVLDRPERIVVSSSDPPFRHYQLSMVFAAHPAANCTLRVSTEIELDSWILQRAVDRMLPAAVEDIIVALAARARSVCVSQHD